MNQVQITVLGNEVYGYIRLKWGFLRTIASANENPQNSSSVFVAMDHCDNMSETMEIMKNNHWLLIVAQVGLGGVQG